MADLKLQCAASGMSYVLHLFYHRTAMLAGVLHVHLKSGLLHAGRCLGQLQVLEWVDDVLQQRRLACLLGAIHTVCTYAPCTPLTSRSRGACWQGRLGTAVLARRGKGNSNAHLIARLHWQYAPQPLLVTHILPSDGIPLPKLHLCSRCRSVSRMTVLRL